MGTPIACHTRLSSRTRRPHGLTVNRPRYSSNSVSRSVSTPGPQVNHVEPTHARGGDNAVTGQERDRERRGRRGVHVLSQFPVGAVLRADNPLARRDQLSTDDLADRDWFQFPAGTDEIWQSYWNGGKPRRGPSCAPSRSACNPCCGTQPWDSHR